MGKKFNKLKEHIYREYIKKGYSQKRAEYIARSTAGEVARRKGK